MKLSEVIDDMKKVQREEQTARAKEYFRTAILPGLKAFAESSESGLYVEEYDERMSVQAVFKNEMGRCGLYEPYPLLFSFFIVCLLT